jgi:hypothetical protein
MCSLYRICSYVECVIYLECVLNIECALYADSAWRDQSLYRVSSRYRIPLALSCALSILSNPKPYNLNPKPETLTPPSFNGAGDTGQDLGERAQQMPVFARPPKP